jgi:hypothetical protein
MAKAVLFTVVVTLAYLPTSGDVHRLVADQPFIACLSRAGHQNQRVGHLQRLGLLGGNLLHHRGHRADQLGRDL